MDQREHYRRFLHFEPGLPPPNIEPGPLLNAWERWQTEGLRADLDPRRYDEWCDALGLARYPRFLSVAPKREPLYREEVIEETGTTVTKRMADGSILQDNKGSHKTIPHYIRPAVTTRAEWDRMREWLDPDGPAADPADPATAEALRVARESRHPVYLHAGGLVGQVRNLLGFEGFCYLVHDDPAWFEEMVETLCRIGEKRVRFFAEHGAPVDAVHFGEDICYKNGPILSPAVFRAVAAPRYRRIADAAAAAGYDRVSVDSDGDLSALLEPWMEGGVTIFCPLEVQAGMDVNVLQERYRGRAVWIGGVHKHRLAGGEREIAAELERLRPAVERGGYLPMADHNVPADVPWENYRTYLRLKREILGIGRGG